MRIGEDGISLGTKGMRVMTRCDTRPPVAQSNVQCIKVAQNVRQGGAGNQPVLKQQWITFNNTRQIEN